MSDTILTQPKSSSLLQPTKFQLNFNRIPDVQYFCQRVNLPGGSVQAVSQTTPFKNRPVAGQKLDYETLRIEFMVEEEMYSWEEIHNWLKDIGTETSFQDYQNLARLSKSSSLAATLNKRPTPYSDGMLTILSTQNNPKIRFHFYDLFPVSLGDIEFSTEKSAEQVYTVEATFMFFYYEISRISGKFYKLERISS